MKQLESTCQLKKDNSNEHIELRRALGPFFLGLEQIRPFLLKSDLTDSRMASLIEEMSQKFTTKREQIKDYVLSDEHVSAYTSLYLTTNIPKLNFLLSKLEDSIVNDLFARAFIDIGSGPGTFSLGMCLESEGTIPEIICVDTSEKMLNQAKKIIQGMYPKQKMEVKKDYLEENRESVLFFGHSINEMGIQEAFKKVTRINPEYVVFIEPATSAFFPELKKFRDELVAQYDVLYPCPSNATCPSDWCHQVLRTSHDQSVERLSQLVSLDRKILPLVAHIYRRKSNEEKKLNGPVMTRYFNETKFSFEYEVCQSKNDKNELLHVEIQKRDLSKKLEKTFKNLNVGEKIEFEVTKVLEKKSRVKLLNFEE